MAQTKEEKEAAAEAAAKAEPKQVIRYTGMADERSISEDDWGTVGAAGQPASKWDRSNRFRLPVEDFSEGALEYLRADSGFEFIEA